MHRPIPGVASSRCIIYHGGTPREIQPRRCMFIRGGSVGKVADVPPQWSWRPLNRLSEGSWADYKQNKGGVEFCLI